MNLLHQALGLANVDADINNLPDGRYDGVVKKSSLVYVDSKDSLSHVINYEATEGEYKGRSKDEWFTLGTEPRLKDGTKPTKGEVSLSDLASFTPTMSEQAKPWYKKRHLDLGFSEEEVDNGNVGISDLVGIPVTFGVKKKEGYVNINFVERRDDAPVPMGTDAPSTTEAVSLDF